MKKYLGLFIILLLPPTIHGTNNMQAVVFAAGRARRFNTDYTKLSAPICGKKMVEWVLGPLAKLELPITVVVGHKKETVQNIIEQTEAPDVTFVWQKEQLGTGHALQLTQHTWSKKHILCINGDKPLMNIKEITQLYEKHIESNADITLITAYYTGTDIGYGRIVETESGVAIVEAKEFFDDPKNYPYINAGMYLFKRSFLEKYLPNLQPDFRQEINITRLIQVASANGLKVATVAVPYDWAHGVNTLRELAHVEYLKCNQLIEYFMSQGIRFIKPDTIHLDWDVTIGKNSIIHPGVQLYNGTAIGKNCVIEPFCILENVTIADNTTIESHTVVK